MYIGLDNGGSIVYSIGGLISYGIYQLLFPEKNNMVFNYI